VAIGELEARLQQPVVAVGERRGSGLRPERPPQHVELLVGGVAARLEARREPAQDAVELLREDLGRAGQPVDRFATKLGMSLNRVSRSSLGAGTRSRSRWKRLACAARASAGNSATGARRPANSAERTAVATIAVVGLSFSSARATAAAATRWGSRSDGAALKVGS
jgi:hypothetical protein